MNSFSKIRDRNTLVAAINDGNTPNWLFFWGHQPSENGRLTKSCLSQWWISPFEVDGDTYPTAEHFMMAQKADMFGDYETRAQILQSKHPKDAKKLGRLIRGFDESAWIVKRFDIVVQANFEKFRQQSELKTFLLALEEDVFVEASPTDTIWGVGLAANDPAIKDPRRWRGLNLLGFALMEVRSRLS